MPESYCSCPSTICGKVSDSTHAWPEFFHAKMTANKFTSVQGGNSIELSKPRSRKTDRDLTLEKKIP